MHERTATEPYWLTVPEIAKEIQTGRRSVYRAIRRGELKATKVNGRDLRICRGWLMEWLERRANAA